MTGVAELSNNIYVVVDGSNKLWVFGSLLFNRREVLVVREMEDPWDWAADLTRLYIADPFGHCVWRVEVKCEQESDGKDKIKVDKWVFEGVPWSLSVTDTSQVLLVDWSENELTICSGKGETLEVIKLKNKGLSGTRHVIQTSPETFLYQFRRPRVESLEGMCRSSRSSSTVHFRLRQNTEIPSCRRLALTSD